MTKKWGYDVMKRFCTNCKEETIQEVKLYVPGNPDADDLEDSNFGFSNEVWECSNCKENTGWVEKN